jgi:diguanylate cyclase (GGDEF)-like protein
VSDNAGAVNQRLMAPNVPVDLSNCNLEPIHIPSLIQSHGMLLAARNSDQRVVYVSANSAEMLGVTPAFILERTLIDILGSEAVAAIEYALGQETYLPRDIRSFTFPISGDRSFDVTAHRTRGLLCVELEIALAPRRWDLLATQLETAMRALGGKTLNELYEAIPPLVRELTGYDRVMVYKFDADGHGEVVGEAKAAEMEPFLGLHYPATDIPRQARKLFLQQRFRTIVDVNYVPVALLGNRELVHDEPLDMTYCGLRSTSPIHIEYLQNMGVGASLAISLIPTSDLWGLIVGHHRTHLHLAPESRALCDLLGQLISLLIGVAQLAEAADDYRAKKLLLDLLGSTLETDILAGNGLDRSPETLLELVHADGAVVRFGDQIHLLGDTPSLAEATALLDAFQAVLCGDTLATDCVSKMLPGFARLAAQASGVLLLPFKEPADGILWLRGEVAQTVRWAGKPDASKQYHEGSFRLSPRKSFALWEQVMEGRSLPWLPGEIDAALGVQRIAVRALLLRSEAKIAELQYTDSLTGLGNRLALLQRKAVWRANSPNSPAALLFLGLDDFRGINKRYGHPIGDEFLRQVGARLGFLANGKHFVSRIGGDEFALFCKDTDLLSAEKLATVILEGLAEPFVVMGIPLTSTASIGIAPVEWTPHIKAPDPLRVADSAMYVAKHKGGNQYSIVESREQAEILRATIAEEVIARRVAAEELAISHARFHSVLDSTSDSVVTMGHDWTMLYANQKAAADLPDFNIGAHYWARFPSVIGTSAERALRAAMSERTEQNYEIFFVPYRRWFRAKAFPVAEGISVFFSDITEEKSKEEQLALEQLLREKRIKALTHMAAGLAHEISNPLAIIHGLASDLVQLAQPETLVEPHEVRVACEGILKTATRASNILRGLRGFAREAAQDPMELASIYEIVDQCVELQQNRLERHDVDLTVTMDPDIPSFLCREVQIGQILTNLINNAFDAITQSEVPILAKERWIELTVRDGQDHICIDVTDNGPGIEDHFKTHLMEPFFTTKELGLGMGVGLSLSRAIAQDHNGTLTLLKDDGPTTFRLTLPISPEATSPTVAPLLVGVLE